MSKDTDKPATSVQVFSDFGQFLAQHREGPAIRKAVEEQGVAQVQPEEPAPATLPSRKAARP